MKRILMIILILVVSIMFTACSNSTESEQTDNEEVQTNEEVENEDSEEVVEEVVEEEIEEVSDFEGGKYTDEATGSITINVPTGYIPSEDTLYSTEDTLATVTVKPQEASSETLSSFVLFQIIGKENAEGYAETYINTFAKDNNNVNEIEIAGLKGFSISSEDEITGRNNENYVLIGPQSIDGSFEYMVLIMGYGWSDSYLNDVHNVIYTLDIDFDKL